SGSALHRRYSGSGSVMLQQGSLARARGGRRRRLWRRGLPLLLLATVALVAGLLIANTSGDAERQLVSKYVRAWVRGDYRGVYALLDAGSRRGLTETQFASRYARAAETATLTALVAG